MWLVAIFAAVAVIAGCGKPLPTMASPEVVALQARGETLVAALERYHAEKGEYPQSFNDLLPVYLVSIPDGSAYGTWGYRLDGRTKNYSLGCVVTDPKRRTYMILQCWARRLFEMHMSNYLDL